MKIFIAYILSPVCFYIGHYASLILQYEGCFFGWFWAEVYGSSMVWSGRLEDWCGKDIVWERSI